MNKILKYSAMGGIITLLTVFPILFFEILKIFNRLTATLKTLYVIIILISFLSYFLFIYGYILIGEFSKNNLLKIISIISLIFAFILNGYYIAAIYIPELAGLLFVIVVSLWYGIIEIIFGIAILKLKKLFGSLATGMGILSIIEGTSFLTILLSIIGVILSIPVYIIGIIILFKANKKFR